MKKSSQATREVAAWGCRCGRLLVVLLSATAFVGFVAFLATVIRVIELAGQNLALIHVDRDVVHLAVGTDKLDLVHRGSVFAVELRPQRSCHRLALRRR